MLDFGELSRAVNPATRKLIMQIKWPWFDRRFAFDFPPEKMPDIYERLVGTTARIETLVGNGSERTLNAKPDGTWSVKENLGHLSDLEPLWIGRIEDILNRAEYLREADLSNQLTTRANHNARSSSELIANFRNVRSELTKKISRLAPEQWAMSAIHPRLKQPMRIVDLCFFVAEHDDYHLARIRWLLAQSASGAKPPDTV